VSDIQFIAHRKHSASNSDSATLMFSEVMSVFGETHKDANTTGVLKLTCRCFVLAVYLVQGLVTD
jgi:hypothetical protein